MDYTSAYYGAPAITRAGISQNNGNGGAGQAIYYLSSSEASSTLPGTGGEGFTLYDSVTQFAFNGGGGASGSNSTNVKNGIRGGSELFAATAGPAGTGSGGSGGHGCGGASATCANRNGAAGQGGAIYIEYEFDIKVTHKSVVTNTISGKVGVALETATLTLSGTTETPTWNAPNGLPSGISINASTGAITGIPTTMQANTTFRVTATDSGGSTYADIGFKIVPGTQSAIIFSTQNLPISEPKALEVSGGSGTGAYTFASSSSACVLSGTRGETVTAQSSSGSCSITVTKAADANWYAASKATTFTLVKTLGSVSLAASPSTPRVAGATVTLTATVGSGNTGTVTFSANGSAISTCGVSGAVTISGISAVCQWSPDSSGSPYTLSASYSGDATYQSANAATITYTIYPDITISYPGISTTFGTSKTSTPTISGGTGSSSAWTWSVKKSSDSSTVSGITINTSGVVSVSNSVPAASYALTVTAVDTVGTTKTTTLQVVVGLSSAAGVTVSSRETVVTTGTTVHLSSTVISAATGTIAFKVGGATISSCGAVSIVSGSASCDWFTTSTGAPLSVTAVYSGDGSYSTVTSSPISITVNPAGSFAYASQNYLFGTTRAITPSITGGTGAFVNWSVVYTSDSSTNYLITVNDVGVVTLAPSLPVGTHLLSISATDSNGVTGVGALNVTVTKATPILGISVKTIDGRNLTNGTLGRQVRVVFNASVPSAGTATVYANGSSICSLFVFAGAAECWWAPANASQAPYSLYISYAGDSNANGGNTSTITNFGWNEAISLSYTNISVETGKSVTISPTLSGGTGAASTWQWGMFQNITGDQIGGITLNGSGVISVSGSVIPGIYDFTVTGSDNTNSTATAFVTITIADITAPTITLSSSSETQTVNTPIIGFAIANSGSDISRFEISGSLPSGLSFNSSTGLISGTPTETITASDFVISAVNLGGVDTATFTLTITSSVGGGSATITISLAGGVTIVSKGTPIAITATVNITGKVSFYINGKPISGCTARHTTSSVSCTWKPAIQGQSVTLSALLKPSSVNYTNARSNLLQVGVGRRTGRR
jgi:hypothetical protein